MLNNCIFHEPVNVQRLASSNVFTQLCLLWVVSFSRSTKFLYFPESVTFSILDGSLQPCCFVNALKAYIRRITTPFY